MTKRSFTLVLAGITVLTAVITSGFTFRQTSEEVKNSKFYQHGSCAGNGEKKANGSQVGWTNSVPDGAGTCSSGGGCHSGGSVTPVFSFTATPAFVNNTYVPGTIYTIAIQVTGYAKFGFDVEMLNGTSTSSTSIGTFQALTNSQIKAPGAFPQSVTHTGPILSTSTATYKWTAPASGSVYVYGDGLGANGNGSDSGDKAVLYTQVLTPASTAGIEDAGASGILLAVYPNPVRESATMSYELIEDSEVSAHLVSLNGKIVSTFLNKEQQIPGKYSRKLNIDPATAKGFYLLSLEVNGKQSFKKIVVE